MHLRTMNSTADMCVRRQLNEAAHTRPVSQANDQQQQNDAEFPEAPHLKKDISCTAADKEWPGASAEPRDVVVLFSFGRRSFSMTSP